jgi:nicotinamidase/pyrazinamidase
MLNHTDALLIVDVQRDFLPGGSLAVPDGDEVIPVLDRVADAFSDQGLPVIASRDWHPPDHCSFRKQGGPWPPHCVATTKGAELDPALDLPANTTVVNKGTDTEKDAYSAFDDTDLDDWLKTQDVQRLFIGGLTTEYCVLESASDAVDKGFDVVLLSDAVRAIDPKDGKRAIETLRDLDVKVLESDEIVDA